MERDTYIYIYTRQESLTGFIPGISRGNGGLILCRKFLTSRTLGVGGEAFKVLSPRRFPDGRALSATLSGNSGISRRRPHPLISANLSENNALKRAAGLKGRQRRGKNECSRFSLSRGMEFVFPRDGSIRRRRRPRPRR